jgi:hypothetical protein
MDNQNKKIRGLIIIVIILVVLIVTLGGYIFYDKLMSKEDTKNNIENSNKNNNNDKVEKEEEKLISENEALSIGNELWEYAYSTYWGIEPAWESHTSDTVDQYGGHPIVCDSTIEQVKQKYASDFKAQSCSDDSTCTNYTIDDFIPELQCEGHGRGGLQSYKGTKLTVKDIQADKIIFIATSTYCESGFCDESSDTLNEIKKDFVIKKQNDNWIIAYFYLPS